MEVPLTQRSAANGVPQTSDAGANPTRATGVYYDRLTGWTGLARLFGYDGGRDALTVHRALADPRAAGRPTVTRLHDLLLETLPNGAWRRVLDAGCGLGGTMLDLAKRTDGTFTGLTLSAEQAKIGRRAIVRMGLESRVRIHVQSYDEPLTESFDAAIAIESLAHSGNPLASLKAIAAQLAPGGWLVVVDDRPEPAARGTRDFELLQTGWQLPVLWGTHEWLAGLRACQLDFVADRDLTAEVGPRTIARIALLEALNRALYAVTRAAASRAMLRSYRGGLALERLYRRGLMTYRLLVARRAAG